MEANKIANVFNRWREVIEAAETPFAKLVIFVLPVMAPLVPASLTGLHLFKLFLLLFTFGGADILSGILSVIVSLVLEMLGYVGAISFIQAVFRWVKTRNDLYILPSTLNGLAYIFYLVLMFLINYKLGQYFETPSIVNTIVGFLSFTTVPTGLLAANYLSQKEIKEDDREIRKEKREERLERLRIKSGGLETYEKVTGKLPEALESYQQVSTNWRNVSKQLSDDLVIFIADHEPRDIVPELSRYEIYISPRTASNWKKYAPETLRKRGLR